MEKMPARRSQRLFTELDFKEADDLGKIYISLMEPGKFPLTPTLEKRLENLRSAWAAMLSEPTQRRRIAKIAESSEVTERTARKIMDDAAYLFGDILFVDDEFEKAFIYDKLKELAKKAEDDDNYEVAGKLWTQAQKLRGYDKETGGLKKGDIQMGDIEFTSDARALNAEEIDESEYTDYEET